MSDQDFLDTFLEHSSKCGVALGMLLMKYRPTAIDIVESSLRSEKPLQLLESERFPAVYRDVAKSFNQDRLRATIQSAATNPELVGAVTESIAGLLEVGRSESLRDEYANRAKDQRLLVFGDS